MPQQYPQLRISEIFYSLQGESTMIGLPTVFVRLTGCPLRCQYCDSAYAFSGGEKMTIDAILERVAGFSPRYVTVTGGEPLAQRHCLLLLSRLCDAAYKVSIETSGAMDIQAIDERVMVVMDLKTPDSKEMHRNMYSNLSYLKKDDQVKFVLCSKKDYEWAKDFILVQALAEKVQLLFSPSWQELLPQTLADWILSDNLPVRMQVQLHKYLWGDVPGK